MRSVAIDGVSASGKSTLAKMLAKKLNYVYLNTGEIYRALACYFAEKEQCEPNEKIVAKVLNHAKVDIYFEKGAQHTCVNGKDYTSMLREEHISELSSKISQFNLIRKKMIKVQRAFAKKNNVVMEGRDIGTVILPKADLKIYLTADVKVRAQRRYEERKDKSITYEEILEDLKERDYRDINRKVAPLKIAKGAVVVDNTNITIRGTYLKVLKLAKERLKIEG